MINLKGVPEFSKKMVMTYKNAITGDIITTLVSCFKDSQRSTIELSKNFKSDDILISALMIWTYVRENIKYKKDADGLQVIQLPGALIRRSHLGGDCKSQSLLISSLLYNLGADNVRLRFVSYRNNKIPTHVYTVFDYKGKTIPVDSVIKKFNYELPFTYKTDEKMNVYALSGIEGRNREQILQNHLNKAERGSFCHYLIFKALQREKGIPGIPKTLTDTEFSYYQKKLKTHIDFHIRTGKKDLCYQLKVNELNDLMNGKIVDSIGGIGKGGKGKKKLGKIFKGVKKIGLAPSRKAFSILVDINAFGLAGRFKLADKGKIKRFWESFGGDYNKLKAHIDSGAKKRAILAKHKFGNISGLGTGEDADPSKAAKLIAAALPILSVAIKLLSGMKKSPKLDKDGAPVIGKDGKPELTTGSGLADTILNATGDGSLIQKGLDLAKEIVNVDENKGEVSTKPEVEIDDKEKTGFKISTPIIIGGAGLLALLLLNKSKK